jgi:N-acetylglucosamine-6-sulfatase
MLGLLALGLALFARQVRPGAVATSANGSRPNVLLIVADDMRFDSLWVMKSLTAAAAQRGVTFSRAYVTTPLCCPSRASILTGRYARNHGVVANSPPQGGVQAFDDTSTLATWLQRSGIRTGLVGRYLNGYTSLGMPPGWSYWFAIWQASEAYGSYYDYRVNDNGTQRYFGSKPEAYSTRVLTEQSLRFLEQDRERPFMLMLAPRAPHGPATADPLDSGKSKGLELPPLPPSFDEEDVSDKPWAVRRLRRLNRDEHKDIEVFRGRQLETLMGLDRAIAALIEALRVDGRLEHTWVIFTADNGLTLGEHRRELHKSCPYEECVRVPLIVIPPEGASQPRVDDHLVANIDLAPTIADILRLEPGGPVDGRSLLPLINDPTTAWRDAVVIEMLKEDSQERGVRFEALRTSDSKYVRYPNGEEELYDEAADQYELQNLAGDSSWTAVKGSLAERLNELLNGDGPAPDQRASLGR